MNSFSPPVGRILFEKKPCGKQNLKFVKNHFITWLPYPLLGYLLRSDCDFLYQYLHALFYYKPLHLHIPINHHAYLHTEVNVKSGYVTNGQANVLQIVVSQNNHPGC